MPKYRTSKNKNTNQPPEKHVPLKREAAHSARVLEGFVEASKIFSTPERDELQKYRDELSALSDQRRRRDRRTASNE